MTLADEYKNLNDPEFDKAKEWQLHHENQYRQRYENTEARLRRNALRLAAEESAEKEPLEEENEEKIPAHLIRENEIEREILERARAASPGGGESLSEEEAYYSGE
jgi:hypothetical protein